jgi:hypothetical protein
LAGSVDFGYLAPIWVKLADVALGGIFASLADHFTINEIG